MTNAAVQQAVEPGVVEGSEGWLFPTVGYVSPRGSDAAGSGDEDARLAAAWAEQLQRRGGHFATTGTHYQHIAVPSRHELYASMDPRSTVEGGFSEENPGRTHRLDRDHAQVLPMLLYPRDYLQQQTDHYAMYPATGSVWTFWGAYITCQLLCGRLGVALNDTILSYPVQTPDLMLDLGAEAVPPRRERIRRYSVDQRARRRHVNAITATLEPWLAEQQSLDTGASAEWLVDDLPLGLGAQVVFENPHKDALPHTVVIFGDAAAHFDNSSLTAILAETFAEVHFIWSTDIDHGYIRQVRPDIVLTVATDASMRKVPTDTVDCRRIAASRMPVLQSFIGARSESASCKGWTRELWLPSETYDLQPPITVQEQCDAAEQDPLMQTNPVTCTDVADARVFFTGSRWLVNSASGETVEREDVNEEQAAEINWQTFHHLRGTTLMFATSAGAHCYYHWMLELLPKLGLLERQGFDLGAIDHVLVREITGDWQLQTLERFGIDRTRIVETKKRSAMQCDRLLHIDLRCGINLKMHRFIPLWMQHLYPLDVSGEPRIKLYISRPPGVRRGIANEDAIRPLLEAAGFTIQAMEGLTVREQARLLARADVVMSPHGGALTNMVFCKPGTKIVEILSRHVYPYYYGLAASCGHVYHALLENPAEDYPRLINHRIAQSFGDASIQHSTSDLSFEVSLVEIQAMLDRL